MVKLLFCFLSSLVSWAENSLPDLPCSMFSSAELKQIRTKQQQEELTITCMSVLSSKELLVNSFVVININRSCTRGATGTDWSDFKERHCTLSSMTVTGSVCSGYWKLQVRGGGCVRLWGHCSRSLITQPDFTAVFPFELGCLSVDVFCVAYFLNNLYPFLNDSFYWGQGGWSGELAC